MDLAQIAEMKNKIMEELRRIEGLKQSMEHTLAGLVEWEKHLQSSAAGQAKRAARRPAAVKEVKPQTAVKSVHPSPSERVDKALAAIHGEFTRSQLLAEIGADGRGEISGATYRSIFSKLLKKQRILCVKGSPHQQDSLYLKSSEKKSYQGLLPQEVSVKS
jgi:hypothetical protein